MKKLKRTEYVSKLSSSMFLNVEDLKPDAKTIREYIEIYKDREMIPITYQELTNTAINSRLQLNTENLEWSIRFGSNRVDVEKNSLNITGSNIGSVDTFCRDSSEIYKKLLKSISRKANRLSLVSYFVLEYDNVFTPKIYAKLFKLCSTFKKNIPFEWKWRVVSKVTKPEINEEVNYILDVSKIVINISDKESKKKIDGLSILIDINTIPTKTEDRFAYEQVKTFYDNVYRWREEIQNDFTKFIEKS